MTQEMGWFDQLNAGELSSRLVADLGKQEVWSIQTISSYYFIIDKIRDGLGDKRADFISLICRIVGGLVFAFVTGKTNQFDTFNLLLFQRMEIGINIYPIESTDYSLIQFHYASSLIFEERFSIDSSFFRW